MLKYQFEAESLSATEALTPEIHLSIRDKAWKCSRLPCGRALRLSFEDQEESSCLHILALRKSERNVEI